MELKEQNILFLSRTMGLGGTENVILQMCEILKPRVGKIVVCTCGGLNEEKLSAMGIKHYSIPDITEKNPAVMYKIWKRIKAILIDENITVIHSHHRMAAFYAQLVGNKKIKRVANAHNTFYDKKFMTRIAYKNTRLIAVGQKVRDNLVDYYGLPSEDVHVIYNAIKPFDGNIVSLSEMKQDRKVGKYVIVNVGRLSEQKGMEYYIEAIKIITDKRCDVRFYIVGDGEDANKLKEFGKTEISNGSLVFLGYRSDIQNIMSQADFVVLSSLWEGFPLTPIEAFSVGKAMVATSVDGTVEIVSDGENGILIPPKDSIRLADRIEYLLNNPELVKRYGENAYNKYMSDFSMSKFADRVIGFYQEL